MQLERCTAKAFTGEQLDGDQAGLRVLGANHGKIEGVSRKSLRLLDTLDTAQLQNAMRHIWDEQNSSEAHIYSLMRPCSLTVGTKPEQRVMATCTVLMLYIDTFLSLQVVIRSDTC